MGGLILKKIGFVVFVSFLVVFFILNDANSASDWQNYGSDDYGTLSFKKGDIDKKGGNYIVQVWKQRTFSNPGRKKYIEATKKGGIWTEDLDKISSVVSLYEIDCRKKMSRRPSIVLYDTAGKTIGSTSDDKASWTAIIRGSVEDLFSKKVCDKK